MAGKQASVRRGADCLWRIAIYIRLSREEGEEKRRGKRQDVGACAHLSPDASSSVVEQEKMLTEWVREHLRKKRS